MDYVLAAFWLPGLDDVIPLNRLVTSRRDRHHQNRNRRFSCIDRIPRTDSTWPNVGEFTTVSIGAVVHHVEQVVGVELDGQDARCRACARRARTARSAGWLPGPMIMLRDGVAERAGRRNR